ncbi:uncharacterized protein LOC128033831 [Gossypium raimondii]|uniref:uncharacterized protein LOC128033831 n=1 Tax=Gossypium raimondii TaxID=29730 RepID=UPI00227ACC1D|nr:uncharacterized protein LOC128033831 [Gossypium raimondii]
MTEKDLNLRQRRWLELLKDDELVIDYHLGKANTVADALSRKSLFALRALNTRLTLTEDGSLFAELKARSLFLQEIYEAQKVDNELQRKKTQCAVDDNFDFRIDSDGCLMFRDRICVPKNVDLIQKILQEAHDSSLTVHPVMDPDRAKADDVKSIAPAAVQGTELVDSRPTSSNQEGKAKQAFYQMMND